MHFVIKCEKGSKEEANGIMFLIKLLIIIGNGLFTFALTGDEGE